MPINPKAAAKRHAGAIDKLKENIHNHEKALRAARIAMKKNKKK